MEFSYKNILYVESFKSLEEVLTETDTDKVKRWLNKPSLQLKVVKYFKTNMTHHPIPMAFISSVKHPFVGTISFKSHFFIYFSYFRRSF